MPARREIRALIASPTYGGRGGPEGGRRVKMALEAKGETQVKKLHMRRGGFTLIELMIVVAIIGILAAIAIPNFLRFQLKAKSSEGKTNLAAPRTAEASYFAEYGLYVSALPSPPTIAKNQKTDFSHAVAGKGFDIVGWEPEGQVYFNYSVNTNTPANDQFTAAAHGDIDNDADPQYWGYAKGTQDGKTHTGLGQCKRADLTAETVMPCTPDSGQSVF
jgi:type IV pilus assembly protein PilA